jgi:hypothetical protein
LLNELGDARDVVLAAHRSPLSSSPSGTVAHGTDTVGTFNQLTLRVRFAK